MRLSAAAVIASLCLWFHCPVNAAISWDLGGAPEAIALARQMQQREMAVEQRGLVQLLHRTDLHISDNSLVERVTLVYFYSDIDAVQNHGSDQVSWDYQLEDIRFLEATTLLPGGKQIQLDPNTADINDTDSYDVFTDQREIVIQSPGLVPNAANVLVFERSSSGGMPLFSVTNVQSGISKRAFDIRIRWSGAKPAIKLPEQLLTCEQSTSSLHCEAENLPPLEFSGNRSYTDIAEPVVVAKDSDWNAVVTDINNKVEQSVANKGEGFKALAKQVRDSDDPIASALEFASRGVRYVSFSNGENSHLPHPIEDTINNRYGDCKDKSALLLALLRDQGHEAYPVLVATDREMADKLQIPSHGYFDHMVVCMQSTKGEQCYDPTDTQTDAYTTPTWIQGSVRLNLLPDAEPSTIPASTYRWRFKVENELAFTEDGGQTESVKRQFEGEYAAWLRERLAVLDEDELHQWLAEEYEEAVSEPASIVFSTQNLNTLSPTVAIQTEAAFDSIADLGEPLEYVDYSSWVRSFAIGQMDEDSAEGHQFSGTKLSSVYRIDLKGLWRKPQLGAEVDLQSQFGEMTRRYSLDGNDIVVVTDLAMPRRWISAEETADFNRFLQLVAEQSLIRVWASPAPSRR